MTPQPSAVTWDDQDVRFGIVRQFKAYPGEIGAPVEGLRAIPFVTPEKLHLISRDEHTWKWGEVAAKPDRAYEFGENLIAWEFKSLAGGKRSPDRKTWMHFVPLRDCIQVSMSAWAMAQTAFAHDQPKTVAALLRYPGAIVLVRPDREALLTILECVDAVRDLCAIASGRRRRHVPSAKLALYSEFVLREKFGSQVQSEASRRGEEAHERFGIACETSAAQ